MLTLTGAMFLPSGGAAAAARIPFLLTPSHRLNHRHPTHIFTANPESSSPTPSAPQPSEADVSTSGREFEELLFDAESRIVAQQAAGLPPTYDIVKIKRIVETAMFAAVTGLAYVLATLLKLESYLSYILPLPVLISSLESGPGAAAKTVTVTFLLLFSELCLNFFYYLFNLS